MRIRIIRPARRGTIIPLLALSLIALLGMIALAVDVGLIAVARTQIQSAADAAALSGVRMLNGDVSSSYNIAQSVSQAKSAATNNNILGAYIDPSNVTVRTGVYRYNPTAQKFEIDASTMTSGTSGTPSSGSWTATEANIQLTSPTYFARVFGINSFDVATTATAVHRPRDVAIILDFSGSMKYSSASNWPSGGSEGVRSMNPDPIWPQFGHYSRFVGMSTSGTNPMQRTTDYIMSSGEVNAPNNLTTTTDNGPPIIGSPAAANFLTRDGSGGLVPAFYNPQGSSYDPNLAPCATPAPDNFMDQTDSPSTYVGDRWPRKGGFSGSNTSGIWAKTVAEFLDNGSTYTSDTHAKNTNWEKFGYSGSSGTRDFYGYSMGPAYYGKTFWIWPPDPRAPVGDIGDAGYVAGDWRLRFFGTNDNSKLFDSSGNLRTPSSGGYTVNYAAILKWIKRGPKVFPDNLRSGRVLYYDSIPDNVTNSSNLDQVFWKNYIDDVLGISDSTTNYHGRESGNWGTIDVTPRSSLNSDSTKRPYMKYTDNPRRPRAHMWFGPYTMLMFVIDHPSAGNMAPGTCTEAAMWQLKVGVQSALDDIQKNHPNDHVALIYFSDRSQYNTPRVKLGQNYAKMKNALWFPFALLDDLGNPSSEMRPINTSFQYQGDGNIPNARGGTCPDMALKLAYNEFSMANGYNGRRGASKLVILETDGVPNTSCGGSLNNSGPYYSTYGSISSIGSTSYVGNGDSGVINAALATADRIANPDTASGLGFSTTRTPARIHVLAFGDLFETSTSQKDSALSFLTNVQIRGNTSPAGATTLESYKIIVGDYNTRVDRLKSAFERIMQAGVQVTLIR